MPQILAYCLTHSWSFVYFTVDFGSKVEEVTNLISLVSLKKKRFFFSFSFAKKNKRLKKIIRLRLQ